MATKKQSKQETEQKTEINSKEMLSNLEHIDFFLFTICSDCEEKETRQEFLKNFSVTDYYRLKVLLKYIFDKTGLILDALEEFEELANEAI